MPFQADLDAFAREAMERHSVPGVEIGIPSPDGRDVSCIGVTALDAQFSKWPDTLFQVGTVSKPFTAPLLAALAEDGKVDLAAFAGKYSQPLADVTLTVDNGGLKMETTSKCALSDADEDKSIPPVHLEPIGEDAFRVTEGAGLGYRVDFIRNDDNSIRFVRVGGRVTDRV